MKQVLLTLWLIAGSAAWAQDQSSPPARTTVVGTQRVGDIIVQGAVIPTWYIPNGVAVAVPVGQPNTQPPPSRPLAVAAEASVAKPTEPVSSTPVPVPTKAASTVATSQESPPARRLSSAQWRSKIDAIESGIESEQLSLQDAKAQLLAAAQDEQRDALEQVAAANRRLEAAQKQAQRASAFVAPSSTAPLPVANEAPALPVVAAAPVAIAPSFVLRRQDRTIPAALTRWAEDAGYQLLWEANEDPIAYEETYSTQFPDAVDAVLRALRLAGRNLRMCEYTNKVVRVVPGTATCKINFMDNKVGAAE